MKAWMLLFLPCVAFSTTHYVSQNGPASGAALTPATAWSLAYAVGSQNPANGTSDTLCLLAGRYDVKELGAFNWGGVQVMVHGKSASEPLVFKGELSKGIWQTFITENDSVHGLWQILGANVTFQDLVFQNTFDRVNSSHYGGSLVTIGDNAGTRVPGIRIINCVARNSMVVGFADNSEAVGVSYEWNVAYFNGKKVDNSNFGYALYGQNGLRGGYKTYRDNIFFDNWGRNAQMYGSSATHVDSIRMEHNILFMYPNTTDANCMIDMTDGDGTLDDPILDSNYFWTESLNGWGRTFRESNATVRAKYRGNWFVKGTLYGSASSVGRVMEGNRYWGPAGPDNINTSAYPNNTWTVSDPESSPMPAWADTVIVRSDPYHKGQAHLVVYNRTGGASKSWNPVGFLSSGDSVYLYDVQNVFGGPVVSAKWTGGAISLPMNLTAVETPICKPAAKGALSHTDARFGCFIAYAVKGSSVTPPPVEPPPPPPVVTVPAPVITRDPASVSKSIQTTFSVAATGTGRKYQWQRNGVNIPGATKASYSTGPLTLSDNGARFRCIVTNAGGSDTSSVATLTVK